MMNQQMIFSFESSQTWSHQKWPLQGRDQEEEEKTGNLSSLEWMRVVVVGDACGWVEGEGWRERDC